MDSSAKVELLAEDTDAGRKPKRKKKSRRKSNGDDLQSQSHDLSRYLRNSDLKVVWGELISLQTETFLSESELANVFTAMMEHATFRWYANRSILDFKVRGASSLSLGPPYDMLNSLVAVIVALAVKSLAEGEELAILQLIVNLFKDGENQVKAHRHRCRQICVSLGASRDLVVEGRTVTMRSGDALPLAGELHSVPEVGSEVQPRISVCLFYASAAEYAAETVSVNSTGDSYWWNHPRDAAREGMRHSWHQRPSSRGSWGGQRNDWARSSWSSRW